MQRKQKTWLYAVLGLMLFSLIIFSALPIVSSVVEGKSEPNSEYQTASFSKTDLAKLEAEASGYEKVLQREPDNETALRGLLQIRLEQKDLARAVVPLEKLARLHPQQTEYSILLAQAKQQLADYEGAAAAYRQILTDRPGEIVALGGLANLFLSQNLPERAIALLQDTLELAGDEKGAEIDETSVELLLGELYASRERYDEAIAIYDKIASADSKDFRPVLAKALVLERQGQLEAAKPILKTALSLAPARYKDQIGAEIEKLPLNNVK